MKNVNAGMVRALLDGGLLELLRVESDGIWLNVTAEGLDSLTHREVLEITLRRGREVLDKPLLHLPCSFGDLHELLLEFGDRLDADDYRDMFGLDVLQTYHNMPATSPAPLEQWLLAFAGSVAATRGYAPWGSEWIGVLDDIGYRIEHADDFPLLLGPSLRRAPVPPDFMARNLLVRPADAAEWFGRHATPMAAEASDESCAAGMPSVPEDADASGPAALSVEELAMAFGDVWDGGTTLRAFLAKGVPKWLEPAIAVRARPRSKDGHQWNPLEFARLLRDQKRVPEHKLDQLFRSQNSLARWREAWARERDAFHQFD